MTKEEIIKALRDMARYPTVTLPRDSEALKVAADLLAQPDPYAKGYADAMNWKVQNHLEHLPAAQPEQEPVKWGVDWGKDGNSVSIIKRLADGNIEVLAWEYAPHPPQRTWVGLTANEVEEIFQKKLGYYPTIYAVEAKLKEKNT